MKLRDLFIKLRRKPTLQVYYQGEHINLDDFIFNYNERYNALQLKAQDEIQLKGGITRYIDLGIAINPPKGYSAYIILSDKMYEFKEIVQTDKIIIKHKEPKDVKYSHSVKIPIYVIGEDTIIEKGSVIAELHLVKSSVFKLEEYMRLYNKEYILSRHFKEGE